MYETEEVERFKLFLATTLAVIGGEPVPSKYSVVVVSYGLPSFAIALSGRLECPISSLRR